MAKKKTLQDLWNSVKKALGSSSNNTYKYSPKAISESNKKKSSSSSSSKNTGKSSSSSSRITTKTSSKKSSGSMYTEAQRRSSEASQVSRISTKTKSNYSAKKKDKKEEKSLLNNKETASRSLAPDSGKASRDASLISSMDIGPVKRVTGDEGILKRPKAFEDGYQFGDITKTASSAVSDVGLGMMKGVGRTGEGLRDALHYGIAGVSDAVGADEFADKLRVRAKENSIDKFFKNVESGIEEYSVLGKGADPYTEGLGQVGAVILTGVVGAGAGLGTTGVTALTTGALGVSSMGSGMTEAYQGGATHKEAVAYGSIKGAVDAVTELLFGGLGKSVKAIGLSKGITNLDDAFAHKLSSKISNQFAKNLIEYGVKSSAEGTEEVLAGIGSAVAKKLTYMSDAELKDLVRDENLLEQFLVGTVTSGIAQSGIIPGMKQGSVREANKTGRDFVTGYTQNEQKVIDKEVENRIKEKEVDGTKLTNKEKGKITEEVQNDLEKGYIGIDTIESTLGGETYNSYKSAKKQETKLQEEYDMLHRMERGKMTGEQIDRETDLKTQLDELKTKSNKTRLREQLDSEMNKITEKDVFLRESYNEKSRRGQAFEADLTKYDEKQREVVKKAIDSGILNNTNRTREFVDMVAKISADKGVSFDFTNNEKLAQSGFAMGGKTINGFVKDGNISVNIQSVKALNTVVGHEITHVLEGTELYTELQNAVKEYATTKGDYDTRYKALQALYKDVDSVVIDSEVTADLIGDYLFTDSDFINRLSADKPNVFQKIYEEIKYLVKTVTGTKEARELEKVKRAFDKAYKESNSKTSSDTKYVFQETVKNVSDRLSKFSLAGVDAVTADKDALLRAHLMTNDGSSELEVFQETGWFRGADGKWRFEIDDSEAIVHRRGDAILKKNDLFREYEEKMEDLLYGFIDESEVEQLMELEERIRPLRDSRKIKTVADYLDHPKLFDAYPFIANIPVKSSEMEVGTKGQYSTLDGIAINKDLNSEYMEKVFKKTLLHELQHVIQHYERFAGGANMDTWKGYDIHKNSSKYHAAMKRMDDAFEGGSEEFKNLVRKLNRLQLDGEFGEEYTKVENELFEKYEDRYFEYDNAHFEAMLYMDSEELSDFEKYQMTAGEIEARDTANRSEWGSEERRDKLPARETEYGVIFAENKKNPFEYQSSNDSAPIRYSLSDDAVVDFDSTVEDIGPVREQKASVMEDIGPVREDMSNHPLKDLDNDIKVDDIPKDVDYNTMEQIFTEVEKTKEPKKRKWAIHLANIVDKGLPFENLAKKTKNRMLEAKWDRTLSAESMAQRLIGKGRKDKGIKALNDIEQEIGKKGLTREFSDYVYNMHNIDRMSIEKNAAAKMENLRNTAFKGQSDEDIAKIANRHITADTSPQTVGFIKLAKSYVSAMEAKNKPVFGWDVTAEISQRKCAEYEAKYPEFKEYAKDLTAYNDYLTQISVESGLITQSLAEAWKNMYPRYVPIKRVGADGNAVNVPLQTNRTGVNAPFKQAVGGDGKMQPLFQTMAERTSQVFRATTRNNFGVELKNTLNTVIEEGDTSLDEIIDTIDEQDALLRGGANGNFPTFTVFEDGQRVTYQITEEMYEALKPIDKNSMLAIDNKILRRINNIRRGLITEYNPVFLFTNSIKDAQDVLINSQHPLKTYKCITEAHVQIWKNGYWYQEYLNNGGDSNTYFDNKNKAFIAPDKGAMKAVKFPLEMISKANNYIEKIPRLAEYIASRQEGRSIELSMLDAARVTTNFKAGGDLTKAFNRNGFTFLNASVQGAVQQVRNVREANMEGAKGWIKLATKFAVAGVPVFILNNMIWEDDEDYEDLSEYVKQNYYVLYKTDNGKFFRIPKGRAIAVIQEALTKTADLVTGDDEKDLSTYLGEATDLFKFAWENLAPNNPLDNNILSPILQAISNRTWYGDELVSESLQELPTREQFDESTDSLSKWLGEKTGFSPVKINYLLDQYSGGIGDTFLPMITPEAKSEAETLGEYLSAPMKDKFSTDSVMNNQNVADFYDLKDELNVIANGSHATEDDKLLSVYMDAVNKEMGKLYGEKKDIQESDLSSSEKYKQVREKQIYINVLAEQALKDVNNAEVNISGRYATVGNTAFVKTDEGEWRKLSNKEVVQQNRVTMTLGVSAEEYFESEDSEYRWDWAYNNPEYYQVSRAISDDINTYWEHNSHIYNKIKADKDENGKTINGSKKKKVIEYIEGIPNLSENGKMILLKKYYPSVDDYNHEIIDYLNNREDISYDEMVTILKQLDFKVDSQGNIYW